MIDNKNMWISFYLQDGTQTGETIEAQNINEAEEILRTEYGTEFGGIADYGFYEKEEDER